MNPTSWIGGLLGLGESQSIERAWFSLAAPWAQRGAAWVIFVAAALVAWALVFYVRWQPGRRRVRLALAVMRAATLSLVFLALAEPMLSVVVGTRLRPSLWLLLDGTDSMAIRDDLVADERRKIHTALGWQGGDDAARADYARTLFSGQADLVGQLEKRFRVRAFLTDRADAVRQLDLTSPGRGESEGKRLAGQWTTDGQVTALGGALEDLARRHATQSLAGLVVVSDFNQNAGPSAVDAARRLGARVFTVGVGPSAAADVAVDVQAPLVSKKDERATVVVSVRQQGYSQHQATVRLVARAVGPTEGAATTLGERTLQLGDALQTVDFSYVPTEAGQFELSAEVAPLAGEVVRENNRAVRQISIRDDFIRLLFVEFEPTWEWRFIKEVFHRDKLVGIRGFRTFLRSADPKVRQAGGLFLPTMSPPRHDFFANDVILLGDLPASALSSRFCEMTEEFVGKFGGGLVVLAGPRFGPSQLAETPLAKMLPVVVAAGTQPKSGPPFRLRLRPEAGQVDFMQLGDRMDKAWENLGPLAWYQPAERLHPMATVLAEHPVDRCADGKMHQPLVVLRRYGKGEVVYLAWNETWRLRRAYGERYYRQFWGQLIHRLALSHALGAQKRFVVRTDRGRYRAGEQVLLTVEAYDKEFRPLDEKAVEAGQLRGELLTPGAAASPQPLSLPPLRSGVFETRLPVYAAGEHRVRIVDPLGGPAAETGFQVASASVERQQAVRNTALERALADATGGKNFDLTSAPRLADEIDLPPRTETRLEIVPLWNTRLFFLLVVGLLLVEWLLRKRINLA